MSAVEAAAAPVAPVAGEPGRDFIRDIIAADLAAGRVSEVVTRFPPEPNGYLHIGHAKAICLNFGVAEEFGGRVHLRFDDTNPTREEQEYIDAIERDVRWLGFDWGTHLHYASDYFEQLYLWAEYLVHEGHAYVDDQPPEAMRAARGTLTEPGHDSPYRDRSPAESLDLFRRMRKGEFPNGARVLRARIDMASGNMNLRDPVLYRILHTPHPRTGTAWCIYPTYDFAHGQSDAIEGVTHSICTLEFEDHRPLYDWLIEHLPVPSRPRQYEFARLNLAYTVLSKRFLTRLVQEGHVAGWDDPRMPTLAGLRRRGVSPEAIREFVRRIGVARANSLVDVAIFESAVRDVLNRSAPRRLAVLRPLKLVIENYPEGQSESLEAFNHPNDESFGQREISFGREIYIESEDFMETAPPKFIRLTLNGWVRLRYAYLVHCHRAVKNSNGDIIELRCTYDRATKSGTMTDAHQKRTGTIHWVAANDSLEAEVRLYNALFTRADPGVDGDLTVDLSPNSVEVLTRARVEPAVATDNQEGAVQFERQGYFCRDTDSTLGRLILNRTIGLRDTWAKARAETRVESDSIRQPSSQTEVSPSAPPQNLRGCGHTYDAKVDSRAHIIPSALGGRLKPRGILCRACNGKLDELVDKPLVKSLGFFITFLAIERDRGESPNLLWTAADGTEYWIGRNGKPSYRRPIVTETKSGDVTRLEVRAPNLKLLEKKLGELKRRFPQIDPLILIKDTSEDSERIMGYLHHGLQLGPATTFPGVLAMLWLFHLHKVGTPFYPWDQLLRKLESPDTLDMFYYIKNPENWLIGPDIQISHRLVLKSDGAGPLFGYVDLFGVIRVGGILTRSYGGAAEYIYVYDLLSQKDRSSEFHLGDAFSALDLEKPGLRYALDGEAKDVMAEIQRRISRILPIGLTRHVEAEKARLVEAFLKRWAASGNHDPSMKAEIQRLAGDIAALACGAEQSNHI